MNHDGLGLDFGPAAAPGLEETSATDALAKIGDVAAAAGISRVEMVAWRDLDHPEAGGSELHAARIAERWAAAGMEVTITASRAPGAPAAAWRDGYRIERPAGRYGIFPAVGASGLVRPDRSAPRPGRRSGRGRPAPDATVEVWNGMPFFSPLWADRPRMVFLHHVHDGMWDLVLPRHLAAVGRLLESRVAPPVYRRTPIVTLSESSRHGILQLLGMHPDQVRVVPPGVDEAFRPGRDRDGDPLVVAVGRLVSYKRFDLLIESLVRLRRHHPRLRAVIAGEGSARPDLEARIAAHGAGSWLTLPGRVDEDRLIELYQRAWVLVSTSAFEGWGLTITEAAACATPAVASPIPGHLDAVRDGVTGFLAEPGAAMEGRIDALLRDPLLRRRMQKAALAQAAPLTWDRTALEALRILAADGRDPGRRRPGRGTAGRPPRR